MNFEKAEIRKVLGSDFSITRLPVYKEIHYEESGLSETIELYVYVAEENVNLDPVDVFLDAMARSCKRTNEHAIKEELVSIIDEMQFSEISPAKFYVIYNQTTKFKLPLALQGVSEVVKVWSLYDDPLLKGVFCTTKNGYLLYIWQTSA